MIWLKTKPLTVISMDMRSRFVVPCVILSASASTREGTGAGEDRLNPLSSSVDLYWIKLIGESWHKALCYNCKSSDRMNYCYICLSTGKSAFSTLLKLLLCSVPSSSLTRNNPQISVTELNALNASKASRKKRNSYSGVLFLFFEFLSLCFLFVCVCWCVFCRFHCLYFKLEQYFPVLWLFSHVQSFSSGYGWFICCWVSFLYLASFSGQ